MLIGYLQAVIQWRFDKKLSLSGWKI